MEIPNYRKEIDAVYPEPLSKSQPFTPIEVHPQKYKRAVKKKMHKGPGRFRTQPVTFDEIKEVDEENIEESGDQITAAASSKSEVDLKAQFMEFSKELTKSLSTTNTPLKMTCDNTNVEDTCSDENANAPVYPGLNVKSRPRARGKVRPSV